MNMQKLFVHFLIYRHLNYSQSLSITSCTALTLLCMPLCTQIGVFPYVLYQKNGTAGLYYMHIVGKMKVPWPGFSPYPNLAHCICAMV